MIITGITIIFVATTIGALSVMLVKAEVSDNFNGCVLGLASGIMIASSIWSLLLPAINICKGTVRFIAPSVGFLLGGLFLGYLNKKLPLIVSNDGASRPLKLFIAVTIHNIPEGLAVGFAFGGARQGDEISLYCSALMLAIGIAVQNIPEGVAVALPYKSLLGKKAFFVGMLSGAVEPLFAVIGFFLATKLLFLQPWFLSFASGAMIFVVVSDLIPEATIKNSKNQVAIWFLIGFVIMMFLDVSFG